MEPNSLSETQRQYQGADTSNSYTARETPTLQSVAVILSLLPDFPNFSPAWTLLCPTNEANYDIMAAVVTLRRNKNRPMNIGEGAIDL